MAFNGSKQNKVRLIGVGILFMCTATTSTLNAAPVTIPFNLVVAGEWDSVWNPTGDRGPLSDVSISDRYYGSFTIDRPLENSGREVFGPVGFDHIVMDDADVVGTLLDFEFTVAGTSWWMEGEANYPRWGPYVGFTDGILTDYRYENVGTYSNDGENVDLIIERDINRFPGSNDWFYVDLSRGLSGIGGELVPVPLPAAGWMFTAAIAFLWIRVRRKSSA